MVAILGPSGAGKTTLLNILSGRVTVGEIYGDIRVNNEVRPPYWKRIVAYKSFNQLRDFRYVEQDDHLYGHLTVKETVVFNAMLRLPEELSRKEKVENTDRILKIFGLYAVRNSRIGDSENRGISGGERKRVSIGNELVADPRVVFLDEPTSGLDSFTALSICRSIKQYAERDQKTVLMTIHQPRLNLLRLFNNILVLSQGKTVFFGTVDEALAHFDRLGYRCPQQDNPADFFLDIATVSNKTPEEQQESQARVTALVAAWSARAEEPLHSRIERERPVSRRYPVNAVAQFFLLLNRNFKLIFRDYQNLLGELITTLVIALLLAFIFFQLAGNFGGVQGRIGLLFFICVNTTFTIVTPLLPLFALDRSIIRKERYASTYRLSAAYFARFISLLPSRLFLFTIFSFIVYYISGLRTDGFIHFFIFWVIIMDLVFTATTLGMLIAASVPTVELGQIIGALIIVIFLLFAGNLANAHNVTWILRWIQYTSPVFYGFESLIQNELHGQTFDGVSGDSYLNQYNLNQLPIVATGLALFGIGCVFFALGYVALFFSTRPKIKLDTKPAPPPPRAIPSGS